MIHQRDSDTTLTDFQVFGERRSGTNFLSELLKGTFFLDEVFTYGWKHAAPVMPCIKSNSLMAVVVRDPVEWLLSMHSVPFEAPEMAQLPFSDFLRSEWTSIYRPRGLGRRKFGLAGFPAERGAVLQYDRHPIDGRAFRNPLEMRVIKMKSHLGLLRRSPNALVVRYEDIANDAEAVLRQIAQAFALDIRPDAQFSVRRVGPKTGKGRLGREDISASDLQFIAGNLEQDLEARFQYDQGIWA